MRISSDSIALRPRALRSWCSCRTRDGRCRSSIADRCGSEGCRAPRAAARNRATCRRRACSRTSRTPARRPGPCCRPPPATGRHVRPGSHSRPAQDLRGESIWPWSSPPGCDNTSRRYPNPGGRREQPAWVRPSGGDFLGDDLAADRFDSGARLIGEDCAVLLGLEQGATFVESHNAALAWIGLQRRNDAHDVEPLDDRDDPGDESIADHARNSGPSPGAWLCTRAQADRVAGYKSKDRGETPGKVCYRMEAYFLSREATSRSRSDVMARGLSGVLPSFAVSAAYAQTSGAEAPVEKASSLTVVIFLLLFVGLCVGVFAYVWWSERRRRKLGERKQKSEFG